MENVKFISEGSYGRAYKVNIDIKPYVVVVKAYKVKDMHRQEALQLNVLSENTTAKIPKVYFTADGTRDIPFDCLCMEYLEGKNALTDFCLLFKSKKSKKRFAEAVVKAMLELHSCTNPKFGSIDNPKFSNWLDYYRPFAQDIFFTAKRMYEEKRLPKSIYKTMQRAWELFDEIFCEEVKTPSLIHGDLNVMNIMVKRPFDFVGIIDPLNAMFADREYDLFQLTNMTGNCFYLYATYKEKYKVSKNCDIKCAFYALWNEIYCFIKTGHYFKIIMSPIVRRMKMQLKLFNQ
ncbi:MAG: phosphotransferase [Clostridiales bacterium]|nr:phosphotransferase [Clostridiales bacterium]